MPAWWQLRHCTGCHGVLILFTSNLNKIQAAVFFKLWIYRIVRSFLFEQTCEIYFKFYWIYNSNPTYLFVYIFFNISMFCFWKFLIIGLTHLLKPCKSLQNVVFILNNSTYSNFFSKSYFLWKMSTWINESMYYSIILNDDLLVF